MPETAPYARSPRAPGWHAAGAGRRPPATAGIAGHSSGAVRAPASVWCRPRTPSRGHATACTAISCLRLGEPLPLGARSPRRFWTRAGAQAATAARLGRGGGGALAVGAGLRAVAADLHRAPLARPVTGRVVERPSTVIGRTDLDPVEPTLDGDLGGRGGEQSDGRGGAQLDRTVRGQCDLDADRPDLGAGPPLGARPQVAAQPARQLQVPLPGIALSGLALSGIAEGVLQALLAHPVG